MLFMNLVGRLVLLVRWVGRAVPVGIGFCASLTLGCGTAGIRVDYGSPSDAEVLSERAAVLAEGIQYLGLEDLDLSLIHI